jgi:alanine dehydrogenase
LSSIAFFDAAAVDAALAYPALIEALRIAFRDGGVVPVRHHHGFARPNLPDGVLLLMPAFQPGEAVGIKLATITPGNEAVGLPSVQAVYVLLDGVTGQPKALIEGTRLTQRRTACASALAAEFLARPDSKRLSMIGCGALAPHLVRAHASVRPIREVALWNRSRPRAEALAAELTADGFAVQVVDAVADAVAGADIVSCATMSTEPLVSGAALAPGTHVDLVGAFTPTMRESDDEAMRLAEVFVDSRAGALAEAGDIVQAIASGALAESDIRADLFELCRGEHGGRGDARAITLFKSVGHALEDLAAARLVADRDV